MVFTRNNNLSEKNNKSLKTAPEVIDKFQINVFNSRGRPALEIRIQHEYGKRNGVYRVVTSPLTAKQDKESGYLVCVITKSH